MTYNLAVTFNQDSAELLCKNREDREMTTPNTRDSNRDGINCSFLVIYNEIIV